MKEKDRTASESGEDLGEGSGSIISELTEWQDSRELVAHTHELIDQYRNGDQAAFVRLFSRHEAPLLRSIARRLGYNVRALNGLDADDFLQRAFMEAFQRIASDRPFDFTTPGSFLNLLVKIAGNRIVDELRKVVARDQKARTAAIEDGQEIPSPGPTPSQELSLSENMEIVEHCLLKLPPRQREVFDMRQDLAMSYEEIAAALGISQPNARQIYRRARKNLEWLVNRYRDGDSTAAAV